MVISKEILIFPKSLEGWVEKESVKFENKKLLLQLVNPENVSEGYILGEEINGFLCRRDKEGNILDPTKVSYDESKKMEVKEGGVIIGFFNYNSKPIKYLFQVRE